LVILIPPAFPQKKTLAQLAKGEALGGPHAQLSLFRLSLFPLWWSQPLPHRVALSALELPEKVRELDCSVRELFDDLFCHERLLRRRERGMQDYEVLRPDRANSEAWCTPCLFDANRRARIDV
jgi:hypothetical protein